MSFMKLIVWTVMPLMLVRLIGHLLKNRISEYRNYINRNMTQSVITDHRVYFSHEFDWDNVEILDKEVQNDNFFIVLDLLFMLTR